MRKLLKKTLKDKINSILSKLKELIYFSSTNKLNDPVTPKISIKNFISIPCENLKNNANFVALSPSGSSK